ncbi:LysR family transcriptional regulator [Lelliottia sp. CFBP8978]|uniref:LysR family transcriptional regulator n=1 Tax=Lelliottia sp. CFBP8978 TaxID=3096522 RepID=UPI002A6ABBF0|nr:LysR family transcriptional regulator [Lelliottia sp. CFBP8978]MDY1036877.1 LysR family transcriptional regulator [Lelliottia sp. CFBP8978]
MLRLEDLVLFVRAAALSSFSNAAREAGIQPAQVSAAIKRLESSLAIRLFARSTRSLRLTPEGEAWLPYARQMLDALQAGMQKIQKPEETISGTLQIAVPSDLGRNLLLPVFQALGERYPALRLRIFFSDQVADVFKDPVDIAFRYGTPEDASYISLPIAPDNRRVLVASPGWVARHGDLTHPDDLTRVNALTFVLRGRLHDHWTFFRDGEAYSVSVSGNMMSDDAEVIRRMTVSGVGVAYKSWLDVAEDVRAGRLQLLMREYDGESVPLNMICPHRKQLSAGVRLLFDAVKACCDGLSIQHIAT